MYNYVRENEMLKAEDVYFKLIKKNENMTLESKDKRKLLKVMKKRIHFIEEEFLSAKKNIDENVITNFIVDNGLELVNDLKEGFSITKENFVKENIDQWTVHFDSVLNYEDGFIDYINNVEDFDLEDIVNLYNKSKEYLDGYQKQKTLTYSS